MAQKKANSKKNTAASGRTNGASASSKTKGRGRTTTREDKRKTAKKKSFLKTEITAIVCILSGCLLILADLGLMGGLGEVVYGVQRGLFGQAYMVSSAAIIAAAVIRIKQKGSGLAGIKLVSVFLLLVTIVSLCELMFGHSISDGSTAAGLYDAARNGADGGGAVGGIITGALVSVIGKAGSLFVYAALIIICAVVITEKSFVTAARTGAERTASAVKVGAGKTIEAARNGHEHYRQAVRENVIRRDAMKEEKRLRRLEMSFKELEPAGDISGDRVEEPDLAGLKENGMDTVRDSEIYRAELYAGYGRDIIGDSQPGVDTLGDVRTPIFRPVIDNNRSTEGVSFDTEVISGVDGYAQESASKEAVNIRSIDYDSDEVPFDVNEEDEYRSYAYILRGESISINAAKQAGYAVGKKSVNDIGRDGGSLQHIKHMAALIPHDAGSLFDTAARHDTDEERNIAENAAELYRDIGGGSYIGINAAADAAADAEADASVNRSDDKGHTSYEDESYRGHEAENGMMNAQDSYLSATGKQLEAPDRNEARQLLERKLQDTIQSRNTEHQNTEYQNTEHQNTDSINTDIFSTDTIDTENRNRELYSEFGNRTGASGSAAAAVQTGGAPKQMSAAAPKPVSKAAPKQMSAAAPKPAPKPKQRPYVYPKLNLLERGVRSSGNGSDSVMKNARKLEKVLRDFGVGVSVTNVVIGPRVSRYELTPAAGVKVSRITSLSGDIKLALAARDIRIEAPIPGKSAVGVEVPNESSSTVKFRDILESEQFRNSRSKLCWGLGLDIGGNTVISDIAKMPHILVAGTTGSGKSVGINSLIMSVLYRAAPSEVRMILVDPKQVEFTVYNGIPHLLTPVVTTPEKALSALNWAVAEMNRRYKLFQSSGTRNIAGYNDKVSRVSETLPEEERPQKLPFILIIIDELSELMMHAKKDVESCIVSLAQLARAAGIHLVVATQRPSVDVITGLIKSNIPSRVAFKLPSVTDSRTILDSGGAEALLGNGDMLYKPGDKSSPIRVQGAFLSDEEVETVVEYIRKKNPADSGSEIEDEAYRQLELNYSGQQTKQAEADNSGRDEYFADAGRLIIASQKASIGGLQRKFKIGFNRAARIMDQLCEAGVVSEGEGTKERQIIMDASQFEELLGK